MSTTNIYINSFNRLESLRTLVEQITQLDRVGSITIVDNNSSYEPLREYLSTRPVDVVLLKENKGPRAAFFYANSIEKTPFIVTDNDLDLRGCPTDLIPLLQEGLAAYPDVVKVGPSLRIDDLPKESPLYEELLPCETRYWASSRDERWYEADIDTTFCLCRANQLFSYGPALRAYPPYQIRHLPWYITRESISQEDLTYLRLLPETYKKSIGWSTLVLQNRELFNL